MHVYRSFFYQKYGGIDVKYILKKNSI